MARFAAGAFGDLVAAAGAAGGDEASRVRRRASWGGRPVRRFSSRHRNARPPCRTSRPCRSKVRSKVSTASSRDQLQGGCGCGGGAERLLVAMPVQQRGLARHRPERQVKRPACRFARDEFLEELGVGGERGGFGATGNIAGNSSRRVRRAGRFEPDDRGAGGVSQGASAASMRRASCRASSTRPAARKVRPQHKAADRSARVSVTRYPARASTRSAAKPFSGSK